VITIAEHSTDSETQHLYAPYLLAELATQIVRGNELATGWDQYVGYTDSTNTHRFTDDTKSAYLLLYNEFRKFPETRNLFIGLDKLCLSEPVQEQGWISKIATSIIPSFRTGFGDSNVGQIGLKSFDPFIRQLPITKAQPSDESSASHILIQELEDEISRLEHDVPSEIRSSIKNQTTRLLTLSIQELDSNQSLIKTKSVRGLYRFLSMSQCTLPPYLSLSEDGMVYARWRRSRTESIGTLFLDGSVVDYALRNLPKKHGGTTSLSELWSLMLRLGFDSRVRRNEAVLIA